jgi:hypothetical protein
MHGFSGVYVFPFRIYAAHPIPEITSASTDGHHRYCVHPPFTTRPTGSPLTPSPPIESWPAFSWSPSTPVEARAAPPSNLTLSSLGNLLYDSLRIDAWGPSPETALFSFSASFLAWLRVLSGQSWIGLYESHVDHSLKHTFEIDESGGALGSPWTNARLLTPQTGTILITTEVFRAAARSAAASERAPEHWTLYHDSIVARAQEDFARSTMAMALSLEVCRNTIFPKLLPTSVVPGFGTRLKKPFDDTDLLEHLSKRLDQEKGRSLKREHPDIWPRINALYICRHHIAHGRPPLVVGRGSQHRLVNEEDVKSWLDATRAALLWIEALV